MAGHINDAARADWCTPEKKILVPLREFYGGVIRLDPCSNPNSLVRAEVEYSLETGKDGLEESWDFDTTFVNPPYGRVYVHKLTRQLLTPKEFKSVPAEERANYKSTTIADWIKRCYNAYVEHGSQVAALIPAAVDTKHWHRYIWSGASAVCFVKGRLRFEGAPAAAPFASALVYWGNNPLSFRDTFNVDLGKVIVL